MEKYQDMVYKCPGPHQRPGGTFTTRGVNSAEEHAAAIEDGWFNSLPEAIAGKASVVELPPDTPPTRAELEQKAKELGIKFNEKTADEVLAKKISEALGA
jgi:hypothetical protein